VIPGVSTTPAGGHRLTQWFNPGAFKIPGCPDSAPLCSNPVSPGRFGDARVNSLEAPDFVNVNAALFKDFSLWEAMHMQFRITAQNVLNHANFSPPANVAINSPTAGNITSTYSETDGSTARQLDIWVRMNF
jgi:hypothetical protein